MTGLLGTRCSMTQASCLAQLDRNGLITRHPLD